MNEVFEQRVEEVKAGKTTGGMDIMGALVKSSYDTKKEKSIKIALTDSEILGNAFILVVAGHETTANAVHFARYDPRVGRKRCVEVSGPRGP